MAKASFESNCRLENIWGRRSHCLRKTGTFRNAWPRDAGWDGHPTRNDCAKKVWHFLIAAMSLKRIYFDQQKAFKASNNIIAHATHAKTAINSIAGWSTPWLLPLKVKTVSHY